MAEEGGLGDPAYDRSVCATLEARSAEGVHSIAAAIIERLRAQVGVDLKDDVAIVAVRVA